jgi:hypothetical protein
MNRLANAKILDHPPLSASPTFHAIGSVDPPLLDGGVEPMLILAGECHLIGEERRTLADVLPAVEPACPGTVFIRPALYVAQVRITIDGRPRWLLK